MYYLQVTFNDEKGRALLVALKISYFHGHHWQRSSNVRRNNALHNSPPPFITHRPSPQFVANPPCHHHHPFLTGVSFVNNHPSLPAHHHLSYAERLNTITTPMSTTLRYPPIAISRGALEHRCFPSPPTVHHHPSLAQTHGGGFMSTTTHPFI